MSISDVHTFIPLWSSHLGNWERDHIDFKSCFWLFQSFRSMFHSKTGCQVGWSSPHPNTGKILHQPALCCHVAAGFDNPAVEIQQAEVCDWAALDLVSLLIPMVPEPMRDGFPYYFRWFSLFHSFWDHCPFKIAYVGGCSAQTTIQAKACDAKTSQTYSSCKRGIVEAYVPY